MFMDRKDWMTHLEEGYHLQICQAKNYHLHAMTSSDFSAKNLTGTVGQ